MHFILYIVLDAALPDNGVMKRAFNRKKPSKLLTVFAALLAFLPGWPLNASEQNSALDDAIQNYSNAQSEYYRELKKIPYASQRKGEQSKKLKSKLQKKEVELKEASQEAAKKIKPGKKRKKRKPKKAYTLPPIEKETEEPILDPSTIPGEIEFSGKRNSKRKNFKKPQFIESGIRLQADEPQEPSTGFHRSRLRPLGSHL